MEDQIAPLQGKVRWTLKPLNMEAEALGTKIKIETNEYQLVPQLEYQRDQQLQPELVSSDITRNKTSNKQLRTRDVIDSLLSFKKYRRLKPSTMDTYTKRFNQFERKFPCLPDSAESILNYLSQFDGETGRHRCNQHEVLNMLYKHAVQHFGW